MTTVQEIYCLLAEKAPPELAEKWDNVGILVDSGVSPLGVLFALDITPAVIEEAAALNCHLIVSHHPVIFHPLKKIDTSDVVYQLISKRISAICMHTNLDAADGGVNDVLADLLELKNVVKFANGCGRIGEITPTSTTQFSEACIRALGTRVKCIDANNIVARVAVVGGSGGDFVTEAAQKGADVLLTGEASHHDALDAKRLGVSLIVGGHYATEYPVVPVLSGWVQAAFPKLKCYVSTSDVEPFDFL